MEKMDLIPAYDEKKKLFSVGNYDALNEFVNNAIENCKPKMVILNDFDLVSVKSNRTIIRKAKDTIKEGRERCNRLYMGTLNAQCDDLMKRLDDTDKQLKEKIDAYKALQEVKPEPVKTIDATKPSLASPYIIEITTSDPTLIDALNELAKTHIFTMEVK